MVDILIMVSLSALLFVAWMLRPEQASGTTETYEEETTEYKPVVVDTEAEAPTEEEVVEEVVTEPAEVTYWCDWLNTEISEEDYELLCRTTYCEAGGEPFKTQVMVCLAILNQYGSDKFADTIHGVVYAKNAFSVTQWKDFEEREWNEETEQAVQMALAENEHPRDMYYFRTRHYHRWAEDYKKVGKVYFSTDKKGEA